MNTVGKFLIALTVVTLATVGCGNNNNPVVPPPPQFANPNGYPGGFGIGGGCGAAGGQNLHPDGTPYNAMLTGQYQGGSSSNSLSISMYYYNAPNADNQVQQIVGSGNFNFPDLSLFMPQTMGSSIPSTFCISSTNPQSGQVNPGTYVSGAIYLVLDGYVQTPYVSPFGGYGYGGGGGYGQSMVEVVIGSPNGAAAGLVQGRIQGQVQVTLGVGSPGAMPLYYQAQ